jgi:small subunit ribosomal protein S19
MRSIWKGPFLSQSLIKTLIKFENYNGFTTTKLSPKKIWSRNSTILPLFVNNFFSIHNGNSFKTVEITEEMVGDKFGQYARTRKKNLNRFKKKKIRKKKK